MLVRFGLGGLGFAFALLLLQRSDRLALALLIPNSQLGEYASAVALTEYVLIVPLAGAQLLIREVRLHPAWRAKYRSVMSHILV